MILCCKDRRRMLVFCRVHIIYICAWYMPCTYSLPTNENDWKSTIKKNAFQICQKNYKAHHKIKKGRFGGQYSYIIRSVRFTFSIPVTKCSIHKHKCSIPWQRTIFLFWSGFAYRLQFFVHKQDSCNIRTPFLKNIGLKVNTSFPKRHWYAHVSIKCSTHVEGNIPWYVSLMLKETAYIQHT